MKSVIVVVLILNSYLDIKAHAFKQNSSCGLDNSPVSMVYEGVASIKTYPWMGMLYYPRGKQRFTTSVVLVTRQMVIAAASEIDKLPKEDFRLKTRVVLGNKCGENEIRIRDYSYHPEFNKNSFSALAMVQLEVDHVKIELRPICQPPTHFIKPQFFVMTISEGCKDPKIRIHRMEYVNMDHCKDFYRKSGLGFSVYGPGCGAPARFLDYGMYHQWIRRSSTTIGMPAISRLGDDHLIMRRSMSSVQRYGPCDPEETKGQLYSDRITIFFRKGQFSTNYNVSLYANVEYSCVIFTVRPLYRKIDYIVYDSSPPTGGIRPLVIHKRPKLRLRRWCATPTDMCHGFQHIEIKFYVEIIFSQNVEFSVRAFGKEAKIIVPHLALRLANRERGIFPRVPKYSEVMSDLRDWERISKNVWFFYDFDDWPFRALEEFLAGMMNAIITFFGGQPFNFWLWG